MRLPRLVIHEVLRLLLSRRWFGTGVLCALAAYLAVGDVELAVLTTAAAPRAWDAHAGALNNLMYIGYLVFPAYVLLVGDTLVEDRKTGYGWVVVPRVGDRLRWWLGKLVTLLVAALAVQLLFLALCLAGGAVKDGWSLAPLASDYATAEPGARPLSDVDMGTGMMRLFAPVSSGTNMAWRQLVLCLYEALAFTALGACLVAVTARFSKAYIPITAAVLGLVADYLAVKAFDGWAPFSPGRRMLEGIHSAFAGFQGVPLWTSLLYWSVLLVSAAVLGGWALRRADL